MTLMGEAVKVVAKNKRAYFDYEVIEKFETGIVLTGPEVKSIKAGHVQMKGNFATVWDRRVWVENMHVSPYAYAGPNQSEPMRKRELLLRKREIDHLAGQAAQKGLTLILLEIYLKKGFIKTLLGVCRGKKMHDKRQVMKERAVNKEINQGLKKFTR